MNSAENIMKQTQPYRRVNMELIALLVAVLCILVVFRESVFLDMQTQKLLLTQQGCRDISEGTSATAIFFRGCSEFCVNG